MPEHSRMLTPAETLIELGVLGGLALGAWLLGVVQKRRGRGRQR